MVGWTQPDLSLGTLILASTKVSYGPASSDISAKEEGLDVGLIALLFMWRGSDKESDVIT